MNKLILMLAMFSSGTGKTNDLIHKHGFENTVLISGQASGLSSTGLVLSLSIDNTQLDQINIDANGGYSFALPVMAGNIYSVEIHTLPNVPVGQSCALQNASGVIPATGVNNLLVTCDDSAWQWDVMNWDQGGWQ